MFHVKRMSNEDLGFAVRAAAPMNWGLVREDFELMMRLEQNGCFVLLSDSERAGIATTISYGTIGWFGNLVVDERHRGREQDLFSSSIHLTIWSRTESRPSACTRMLTESFL